MGDALLTFAILPGIPRPETEGPHYESLMAYVRAHGQPHPVLVDQGGVVWAGRTIVNVCCDLGLNAATQVVQDGLAAAIHELATRDLTVLEKADLVLTVHDDPSTNFVLGSEGKRSKTVSSWFKNVLGKAHGYSTSQVEQYLRVARSSGEQRLAMASARNLHQAMRIMKALEAPAPPSDQGSHGTEASSQEEAALETAASFMEAFSLVESWTTESLEMLRSLRDGISGLLRTVARRKG